MTSAVTLRESSTSPEHIRSSFLISPKSGTSSGKIVTCSSVVSNLGVVSWLSVSNDPDKHFFVRLSLARYAGGSGVGHCPRHRHSGSSYPPFYPHPCNSRYLLGRSSRVTISLQTCFDSEGHATSILSCSGECCTRGCPG